MADRAAKGPVLVRENGAVALERIPLEDRARSEEWLQELIFANPCLLPLAEIEPVACRSAAVAREVPTDAGPIDLLLANAEGTLTLVETKLWRNPGSRREAVAQVIDYAAALARWDYEGLRDAVREATGAVGGDPLADAVRRVEGDGFDEARFIDAVARNLRHGRFLLLIVGDGIREGAEHLADYLQRTPHLGFTLALVELALYKVPGTQDLLVAPSVVARTREVVRAVVEVRAGPGVGAADIRVAPPASSAAWGDGRVSSRPLTEQAFIESLEAKAGSAAVDAARWILVNAPKRGLRVKFNLRSLALFYDDPESGCSLSFGHIGSDGDVPIYALYDQCERQGLPDDVWRGYYEDVVRLVPGARIVANKAATSGREYRQVLVGEDGDHPSFAVLGARKEEWLESMNRAADRAREALAGRPPA